MNVTRISFIFELLEEESLVDVVVDALVMLEGRLERRVEFFVDENDEIIVELAFVLMIFADDELVVLKLALFVDNVDDVLVFGVEIVEAGELKFDEDKLGFVVVEEIKLVALELSLVVNEDDELAFVLMIFADDELAVLELALLVDGSDDDELVFAVVGAIVEVGVLVFDEDRLGLVVDEVIIVVAFVFMLAVDELAVFGVEELVPFVGVSIKEPFLHPICESLVIV